MGESDGLWSAGFAREREYTRNIRFVCQVSPGGLVYLEMNVQDSLANTDKHRPFDRPSPLVKGLSWGYIVRKHQCYCQHSRHVKHSIQAVPDQDQERFCASYRSLYTFCSVKVFLCVGERGGLARAVGRFGETCGQEHAEPSSASVRSFPFW